MLCKQGDRRKVGKKHKDSPTYGYELPPMRVILLGMILDGVGYGRDEAGGGLIEGMEPLQATQALSRPCLAFCNGWWMGMN